MFRKLPACLDTIRNLKRFPSVAATNHYVRCINTKNSAPVPPDQLTESMVPFRNGSAEEGFVWTSPYGQINVADMTLDEYVWQNVDKWQHQIAIVCGITGRKYSYGKLRDHCAAVAYRLRKDFNLKPGDVVAISMANVPEYAIVALGALEAGLTLTTINPVYSADEQAKQLAVTDAKMIFSLVENAQTVLNARSINNSNYPVVAVKTDSRQSIPDGVLDFANLMELTNVDLSYVKSKSHKPQDVCVVPFSSGTSGMPKGVMLTHINIISSMAMSAAPNPDHSLTLPTTKDFQDVIPCVLPFFHIFGLSFVMMTKLSLGCKLVTLPRFDPATYVSTIAEHKATFLALVPPILNCLTNDDRCTTQHLSHVRTILSGAAPIGAELVEQFHSKKGRRNIDFIQGFGMTETSPSICLGHSRYANYGSIGWPCASTEVKIVRVDDPQNLGLDANEHGELLVRSPAVMLGYLDNPTETANAFSSDGWLRTGDVGFYDNNGDFYITDRAKELIKVQAFQVAPAELEDILCSHPQILEAGVIGVKHDKFGEVPKAFIVRKDDMLSAHEIQEFIAARCSKYKWLVGGVEFIDKLPTSSTGKILRRELRLLEKPQNVHKSTKL